MYKYGGADDRFFSLGGMQMLLWRAIEDAKKNCLQEFDLGQDQLPSPDDPARADALDVHEFDVLEKAPVDRITASEFPGIRPDPILLVDDLLGHIALGDPSQSLGIPPGVEPSCCRLAPPADDLDVVGRHRPKYLAGEVADACSR